MKTEGKCELASVPVKTARVAAKAVGLVRTQQIKIISLLLDDYWLYSYHRLPYKGALKQSLESTAIVEDTRDQILSQKLYTKLA